MRIGYIDNGLRKMCALILVGTIAGTVSYGQVVSAESADSGIGYYNELLKGHYYDEDIKKKRDEITMMITEGSSSEAKTYGKKRQIVPKTITK